MTSKMIKKLIKRQKEHLKFKKNLYNDQYIKDKIDKELEMIDKLGIDAFGCTCIFFKAGDIVRITYEVSENERVLEGRILIYNDEGMIIVEEKTNKIIDISKFSIVLMELLDIAEDSIFDYVNSDYEKYMKRRYENGDEIG